MVIGRPARPTFDASRFEISRGGPRGIGVLARLQRGGRCAPWSWPGPGVSLRDAPGQLIDSLLMLAAHWAPVETVDDPLQGTADRSSTSLRDNDTGMLGLPV